MNPWTLNETRHRFLPLEPSGTLPDHGDGPTPEGLLITCSSDCFDAHLLEAQLEPGSWYIHRTMAGIMPTYGSGHRVEEDLIEQAVNTWAIRQVVVCGHWPCRTVQRLIAEQPVTDDFLLRHLQSYAEAVRCLVDGRPRTDDVLRQACEHHVRVQINHLRTYPAVAAALEARRLQVFPWLHDDSRGELFYPTDGQGPFDRYVALNPDQNRHLRSERIQKLRPRPPLSGTTTERIYLA